MEIRPLGDHDADATITLWRDCGLTRPWNDPRADFDRALAGQLSTVLGAFDEVALVGSVMVGVDGHRGWIYYLASDPGRRHAGIGRALLGASEEWLIAHDAPKIQFMVRTDNEAARAYYEYLGYELQDCVVYGRRLDGVVPDQGNSL